MSQGLLVAAKRLKAMKHQTIEFLATQSYRLLVSELSKNKILLFQAAQCYLSLEPRETDTVAFSAGKFECSPLCFSETGLTMQPAQARLMYVHPPPTWECT